LLNTSVPVTSNSFSSLIYDPADPSPTHGGPTLRQDQLQGPYDQSVVVESRNDILMFTGQVLTSPVQVTGSPTVRLFVMSDRKDTDFAIRLCDVYPDGKSILISDGIKRMRFRDGYTTADTASMSSSQIYQIDITLPNTAYTFLPGHSIRVDVTSSNYPRFDNNLNNGLQMYVAGDTLVALNKVYHDAGHESYIMLPVTMGNNIADNTTDSYITLSPNPADTYFRFTGEFFTGLTDYKIVNSIGQIVKKGRVKSIDPVNITELADGIYYVICEGSEKESFVSKLIVR
jgi:hypothetical protein